MKLTDKKQKTPCFSNSHIENLKKPTFTFEQKKTA